MGVFYERCWKGLAGLPGRGWAGVRKKRVDDAAQTRMRRKDLGRLCWIESSGLGMLLGAGSGTSRGR